jgi:hypothetical protein
MEKIGGIERKIMLKYRKARIIDPEDKHILDKLAATGLVGYGISFKHKQFTAKITQLGYAGLPDGWNYYSFTGTKPKKEEY